MPKRRKKSRSAKLAKLAAILDKAEAAIEKLYK